MKINIFWLVAAAAWLTHLHSCITTDRIALLWAGTLIPPIGWLHGIGVWLQAIGVWLGII